MSPFSPAHLQQYGIAILLVIATLMVTLLLDPWLSMSRSPFLLFFGAVMLSAWAGGIGAGIVATALSTIFTSYFFLPPDRWLVGPQEAVRLALFVLEAMLISGLCSNLRRTRRQAERNLKSLQSQSVSLRQSEERLRVALKHSPITVFNQDRSLHYTWVSNNPTSEGMADDLILGKHDRDLLPPEEAEPLTQLKQRVLRTGSGVRQEAKLTIWQQESYYDLTIEPLLDGEGHIAGITCAAIDITARKQTEIALRQSESRFKRLVQANVVGCIFWHRSGEVQDANDAFLTMTGYSHDDLKAGRINWRSMTPPDQLHLSESSIGRMQQVGAALPIEKEYIRKDGTRVPVLLGGVMFEGSQDQGVSFVIDLSDLKQTEAALRESETRYRLLAEALPQFVWIANPSGQVEYCNPYWYRYTGLTPAQTLGYGWANRLHPDDRQHTSALWHRGIATGQSYELEGRVRGADGEYRWFLASVAPLYRSGRISKWVGTAVDIDDRKRTEQERNVLLQREQTAREAAEAANRIKDEFLAVLSHELRTPLNPILGWAKLLQQRKFDSQTTARALETIERNAKLQTQLIEDLLDVSRILRGKLHIQVQTIDLIAVTEAAIDTVRLAAEAKEIDLVFLVPEFEKETEIPPAPHPLLPVLGDSGRLQQVVWNLLTNAIKFTPASGRVEVRLEKLEAAPAHSPIADASSTHSPIHPYAQLTVSDTGRGIPATFLPHVFEYFRQADGTTTRQVGGLGLGLAIAKHLVELHGGSIEAESAGEGQGATFRVRLPLQHQQSEWMLETVASERSLTGLRVLIVDDEADIRELMAVGLEQAGAIVTAVASAQAALQVLETASFDLLLSDIGMPEMDGYMLIQTIRAAEQERQTTRLSAIALTAYAGETDRQQALAAGFDQHLAKPIAPNDVSEAIAQLLQHR